MCDFWVIFLESTSLPWVVSSPLSVVWEMVTTGATLKAMCHQWLGHRGSSRLFCGKVMNFIFSVSHMVLGSFVVAAN